MDGSSSDQPTLQRRSSQVSYATVNGITLPNYSHISTKPKKASKSESSEDNLSDEEALAENDANLCAPRNVVTDQLLFWVFQKCLFLAFLGIIMDVNSAVLFLGGTFKFFFDPATHIKSKEIPIISIFNGILNPFSTPCRKPCAYLPEKTTKRLNYVS